jgi:Tol biopolymer transport system component
LGAVVLAAAAGVTVGVIGARQFLSNAPGPQPSRALQRVTYDEATLPREASWAPDGRSMVYTSDRAGNADLWTQRLGDPDPIQLTFSAANESQPQWSPDGQSIVFRSERDGGGLFIIPATGGAERRISAFGYEPKWSPDGSLVLFKRSTVLPNLPAFYVVGLDGRPPRAVRPEVLAAFGGAQVAWHPDGRRMSVWATTDQGMVFLTVPIDSGDAAAADVSPAMRKALAGISAGKFVWAP